MPIVIRLVTLFAALAASPAQPPAPAKLELAGVTMTPHLRLETMRYRREPEPAGGARVQLFLRHAGKPGDAPLEIAAGSRLLFGGKPPADLFRLDADGARDVRWAKRDRGVEIADRAGQVAVYVATPDKGLRARIEAARRRLLEEEAGWRFDPARSDADYQQLVNLLEGK